MRHFSSANKFVHQVLSFAQCQQPLAGCPGGRHKKPRPEIRSARILHKATEILRWLRLPTHEVGFLFAPEGNQWLRSEDWTFLFNVQKVVIVSDKVWWRISHAGFVCYFWRKEICFKSKATRIFRNGNSMKLRLL